MTTSYTLHHGDCLDVLRTLPDARGETTVKTHPITRGFRLTPEDMAALDALVEAEERNRSDVMRRLIREAARARGLLPMPTPITAADAPRTPCTSVLQ